MAGFDDILKTAQMHQTIQKSMELSSQLSEMFNAQEKITKNISGLSMSTELAKSKYCKKQSNKFLQIAL